MLNEACRVPFFFSFSFPETNSTALKSFLGFNFFCRSCVTVQPRLPGACFLPFLSWALGNKYALIIAGLLYRNLTIFPL